MTSPYAGRAFVFDLETDGLLDKVTRVHCAVAIDIETEEVLDFKPNEIGKFLDLYVNAAQLIGHNIIGYDCKVIEMLYGIPKPPASKLIDTVNLARLVFPDIKASDLKAAKAWKDYLAKRAAWQSNGGAGICPIEKPLEFPGQFCGTHSLEAWGYRLGNEKKDDYSARCKALGIDPWAAWNPDMHAYMIQDGRVNLALFRHLMGFMPSPQAILLEMRVQRLCSQIEFNGWPFAVAKAQALYVQLCAERDELSQSLRSLFPSWTIQLPDFIPKRDNRTRGYKAGVPVPRFETIEFNPGSREHIANRLGAKYGWQAVEYTESGKPKIDDDVLSSLPYPEAQKLARYFVIQKRIGQLAEGKQAWLRVVSKQGFIHGRYNTNGAATGRATHGSPNVAQVPAVRAAFGKECRELFTVRPGFVQIGADQAGLELRCLASFLAVFDGGAYIQTVLFGDVHWENAKALFDLDPATERYAGVDENGDPIKVPLHEKFRDVAKTFIYAFLYGAGDEKLGSIAGVTDEEAKHWQNTPAILREFLAYRAKLLKQCSRRKMAPPTKQQMRHAFKGFLLRERFLKTFPALAALLKHVKKAAKKGWLKGLDGRHLPVRSEHAALNTLLQSAGAVICKQWICDVEDALVASGLTHGWTGDFVIMGWIHDEIQVAVREGLEETVCRIIVEAARKAGDPFKTWKCPTDGDTKVGRNWAECH